MKLCFFMLLGLVLGRAIESHAKVLDADLKKYGIAGLYPEGQQSYPQDKYPVVWRGKSTSLVLHPRAGLDILANSQGAAGTVRPEIAGIKVRVRAFNERNQEVGQINGPGRKDDTFLTGQPCRFMPPAPGSFRLTIEVLGSDGRVIPVRNANFGGGQVAKALSQKMELLVYLLVKPEITISYGNWMETPGQRDLYERAVSIVWHQKSTPFIIHTSAAVTHPNEPEWIAVNLRVEPRLRHKNLYPNALKQISWLSISQVRLSSYGFKGKMPTQYFLYQPTRDTPREPDFYEVKVQTIEPATEPR